MAITIELITIAANYKSSYLTSTHKNVVDTEMPKVTIVP